MVHPSSVQCPGEQGHPDGERQYHHHHDHHRQYLVIINIIVKTIIINITVTSDIRLLLVAEPPGRVVVHPSTVHCPGELWHQDGAPAHADPCQPHCGLRVRLLFRPRVQRLHEADALPGVHADTPRALSPQEAGHSVTAYSGVVCFRRGWVGWRWEWVWVGWCVCLCVCVSE